MFQNSFFLEQLSVNVSVLGVALVEPYQSSKYFALQTNMHTWELCEIAFAKKQLEHATKIVLDGQV